MEEVEFVPYCAGDVPRRQFISEVLKETFQKAGVNWIKRVLPPAPPEHEERTQAFEGTVLSFIDRAKSVRLETHQRPVLVMPYSGQPEQMNWAMQRLSKKLPQLNISLDSKHILLVPDMPVANQLRDQLPRFGSLHGEMGKGGTIQSSSYMGIWFVITWRPSIPTSQLGNMLSAFLRQDRIVTNGDRESIVPGDLFRDPPSSNQQSGRTPMPPDSLVDWMKIQSVKIKKHLKL